MNNDGSVTATSPVLPAGVWDVTVTTLGGTSAVVTADHYTAVAGAGMPTVTGLDNFAAGSGGGTTLTISGSGFTGATAVYFGDQSVVRYTVNSSTSITVVTPPSDAGTVDVTVVTGLGTSPTLSADRFTTTANSAAPTVTGVSMASGSNGGGTLLTVMLPWVAHG